VLGDRRSCDGQLLGKLTDRARAAGEPFEDGAPGLVTESPDPVPLVSMHLP
jgi:hypothetical protein